jgi:CRISPR-associated protein Cas8a1/Csx13
MDQMTREFCWSLSDDGMGLLERAGLAALYMTLRAADESGENLSPLEWDENCLTPDRVTIRIAGNDRDAITRLFEYAWQTREGVLYFPAVHRDGTARDNSFKRAPMHNGITRTFLQHPRVQPKGKLVEQIVELDENRHVKVVYQPLDSGTLKPISDLKRGSFFGRDGALASGDVELSSWVFPGIAPRYGEEVAWRGPAALGLLLMLAPISCLYQQLHSEPGTWLFVIPDVHDLEEFNAVRTSSTFVLDSTFTDVASLGDAGLRFLSEYTSYGARQDLQAGCRVVAMGKVGYYQSQSIRKGIVDVDSRTLANGVRRYAVLHRVMKNRWAKRKVKAEDGEPQKSAKRKKKPSTEPQPTDFIATPTGRGRIADNLIERRSWYEDLFTPLPWDHDALERQRKRKPGTSIERLWFENLFYQRRCLMELIQEDDMWDIEAERLFVEGFWQILKALYRREAQATERGGSRSAKDRMEDLNEEIRRELMRAKTRPLLRETIADLFARPVEKFRSPVVRKHPATIWRFIDDDWKRARDLALLALASYPSKEKPESEGQTGDDSDSPDLEGAQV